MKMKTVLPFGFLLFVHAVVFSQTLHRLQRHTDAQGYRYQTVTNDPAALRVYTLRNGLTVYLAQVKDLPTVIYATAVRAGSAYDPNDNTGLAHYLEHLLFNGTDKIGTLNWKKEQPLLSRIETLYQQHKAASDTAEKKALYRAIDSLSYEASVVSMKGEYRKLLSSLGGVAAA